MRIETNDKGEIILKEVYSGIGLETSDGEYMGICMRDTGFEFNYNGTWYSAQKGVIIKICEGVVEETNDISSKEHQARNMGLMPEQYGK